MSKKLHPAPSRARSAKLRSRAQRTGANGRALVVIHGYGRLQSMEWQLTYPSGAAMILCPSCNVLISMRDPVSPANIGQAQCSGCHQFMLFPIGWTAVSCTQCHAYTPTPPPSTFTCRCGLALTYASTIRTLLCTVCNSIRYPPAPVTSFLAPLPPSGVSPSAAAALHTPYHALPIQPPYYASETASVSDLPSTPVVTTTGLPPPPIPRTTQGPQSSPRRIRTHLTSDTLSLDIDDHGVLASSSSHPTRPSSMAHSGIAAASATDSPAFLEQRPVGNVSEEAGSISVSLPPSHREHTESHQPETMAHAILRQRHFSKSDRYHASQVHGDTHDSLRDKETQGTMASVAEDDGHIERYHATEGEDSGQLLHIATQTSLDDSAPATVGHRSDGSVEVGRFFGEHTEIREGASGPGRESHEGNGDGDGSGSGNQEISTPQNGDLRGPVETHSHGPESDANSNESDLTKADAAARNAASGDQ